MIGPLPAFAYGAVVHSMGARHRESFPAVGAPEVKQVFQLHAKFPRALLDLLGRGILRNEPLAEARPPVEHLALSPGFA